MSSMLAIFEREKVHTLHKVFAAKVRAMTNNAATTGVELPQHCMHDTPNRARKESEPAQHADLVWLIGVIGVTWRSSISITTHMPTFVVAQPSHSPLTSQPAKCQASISQVHKATKHTLNTRPNNHAKVKGQLRARAQSCSCSSHARTHEASC
jgi:hypothetical protein